MTGREHSKLIGTLFLVWGGLNLLGLLVVGVIFMFAGGIIATEARGRDAAPLIVFFAFFLIILLVSGLFVIPTLVAGWKMLKLKTSSKVWAIVAAVLAIMSFPFGTALGVYALWFIFGDEGRRFYNENSSFGGNYNPPPPPNVWR